jgi:uncharacterized lipoprotein YddW (UPF0748 family)
LALCVGLVLAIGVGAARFSSRDRPTSVQTGGDPGAVAPDPRDGTAAPTAAANRGSDRSTERTCAGHATQAAHEMRGVWLTTVNNIDFPSKRGLPEAKVKEEYLGWLDLFQRLNFNAVFVHIRPSGDAWWPSEFAPWSEWLTGTRDGGDPGWDPLKFMIDEAHARNIEFHGWFNPYRGSQPTSVGGAGANPRRLAPGHPLRRHPEWILKYPESGPTARLLFNPGIPEARVFVEDSILDAVNRYDLDGVHFDDFFYPYPEGGDGVDDKATFATYGKGFKTVGDWRRDNVNKLVQEMSVRIKAAKPWVKFGISPFGIWRNSRTDRNGSDTRGLQSYDDIYADTKLWVTKKWLDYIVPQLYWHIGFDVADYEKLLPWWTGVVSGTGVQLYIGQADYRVGEDGPWSDPAQLDRQLTLNKQLEANGSVHFSAKSVRADKLGAVTRYQRHHYASPALVPTMARLPAAPPPAPTVTNSGRDPAGEVHLSWKAHSGSAPTGFAIYRVGHTAPQSEPARLVATVRSSGNGEQTWADPTAAHGDAYVYCVTGLDRTWNEGAASQPQTVPASAG